MSVYLNSSGMNIETTNFYYKYLSQINISTGLTSLCVSDRFFSIDSGLWFAEHESTFINLRCLSLIDVKWSSCEMILNSLSFIHSLNMLTAYTFQVLSVLFARFWAYLKGTSRTNFPFIFFITYMSSIFSAVYGWWNSWSIHSTTC